MKILFKNDFGFENCLRKKRTEITFSIFDVTYHSGLSTLKEYHSDSMGLHEFFHRSAIFLKITNQNYKE